MSERVYLGIDLGTQSVRVIVATAEGRVVASASDPLTSTRHVQDPLQWWKATSACLRGVVSRLNDADEIAGIAVDATSGTILLVDDTLTPVTEALMYDDGRAIAEAAEVNARGGDLWRQMSYRMQPSWALPKLLWLLRNTSPPPNARLVHQNDFVNAWLAGQMLATDSSQALKTGYDLTRSTWPWQVLDALRVPLQLLPSVVAPGTRIGEVSAAAAKDTGLRAGIPIFAGMTDGCAAQIASGATSLGRWNSVIGTTLVVKGVTENLLHDPSGVVYSHRSQDGLWLPGGASSTGGAAIAKNFSSSNLDALNASAAAAEPNSVVIYPLVSRGERFPFANSDAEGFMLGTPSTDAERFAAVLQGIALLERLVFDTVRALGASTDGACSISGGAAKSDALNQFRANMLEKELLVPEVTEGAFGMAILAASSGSSLAKTTERMVRIARRITPNRPFDDYAEQYGAFLRELERRGYISASAKGHALSRGVA